jgi:two-component system CheB/CheR fusion protein
MDATHAEFQRQLRSVFTVLRAVVRRTCEGREDLEEYAAHLESRIGALSRVSEMLMRGPDIGVDLHELVCGELLAQAVPPAQYSVDGPEIRLAREAAAPLALTLHELAMNALLHGAFGTPHGRVKVAWECVEQNGAPWLRLEWIERGVALASDGPPRRGFGLEVIERTLPYELGAQATLHLSAQGAEALILMPAVAATAVWTLSSAD